MPCNTPINCVTVFNFLKISGPVLKGNARCPTECGQSSWYFQRLPARRIILSSNFCCIWLEVPLCPVIYPTVSLVLLLYAQKPKITCLSYLSSRLKTFQQDGWAVLIFRFYKFRLAFAGIIVEEFCKPAEYISGTWNHDDLDWTWISLLAKQCFGFQF
jgi:hypothetical protein